MRRRANRQRKSINPSLPSPFTGLNARDALDTMPPTDAIELINWLPFGDAVKIRPGYVQHASGVGATSVSTVAAWEGPASSQLIAAGDGSIYNATAASTATSIKAGFSSDDWQTNMFNGRLFFFNGTDAPQDYNGATSTSTLWTGSGLTIANLIQAVSFKQRLYIAETDQGHFWYGAPGAVTGALTKFQLDQIAQAGGYLMAIGTWSQDGGDGLDDLLVFVMSSGEVIVYSGIDPASAGWFKVGSYMGAPPIGRRCLTKIGGELVILTETGYMPLSILLQSGVPGAIDANPIWGKIRPLVEEASTLFRTNEGWAGYFDSSNGIALWNIPTGTNFEQHVLNTVTGAWTTYNNLPARAWALYSGDTYFGDSGGGGIVWKHSGQTDNANPITFKCRQAFSYLGNRGVPKNFTAIRPIVALDGSLDAVMGVNVDFSNRSFVGQTTRFEVAGSGAEWDAEDWDSGEWAGSEDTAVSKWVGVAGYGENVSVFFSGGVNAQNLKWYSTKFLATPSQGP